MVAHAGTYVLTHSTDFSRQAPSDESRGKAERRTWHRLPGPVTFSYQKRSQQFAPRKLLDPNIHYCTNQLVNGFLGYAPPAPLAISRDVRRTLRPGMVASGDVLNIISPDSLECYRGTTGTLACLAREGLRYFQSAGQLVSTRRIASALLEARSPEHAKWCPGSHLFL